MTIDAIKATLVPEGKTFFDMGLMYATGRECELDLVAAHCWFNIAAMRGDREAAIRRAELASEMSAMDIASAQRAAREWLSVH
jgi:TPR repeat protein